MMSATYHDPQRIWVSFGDFVNHDVVHVENEDGGYDAMPQYHLARPGQPCSTDEFLARVFSKGDMCKDDAAGAIFRWHLGDFAAAMEGLE